MSVHAAASRVPADAPPLSTRLSFLGPLSTHAFNRLMAPLAGGLPGLGLLTHVGRTTGRTYQTPLLVIRQDDGYVIGLWYGAGVQWVKNVVAAGGCTMRVRRRDVRLAQPVMFIDPGWTPLPRPLRLAARIVRMTTFLRLSPVPEGAPGDLAS